MLQSVCSMKVDRTRQKKVDECLWFRVHPSEEFLCTYSSAFLKGFLPIVCSFVMDASFSFVEKGWLQIHLKAGLPFSGILIGWKVGQREISKIQQGQMLPPAPEEG